MLALGGARAGRLRLDRLRLEADPAVARCGTPSGTTTPSLNDHLIVRSLRVPRTVLGLAVGVALGLAGAVMQGVTRNPLADPGILGIEAGRVAGRRHRHLQLRRQPRSPATCGSRSSGPRVASVVVYAPRVAGPRRGDAGEAGPRRGGARRRCSGSFTSAILLLDVATLDQFRFWVVGSLAGRDATIAVQVLPFIVVGIVLALALGPVAQRARPRRRRRPVARASGCSSPGCCRRSAVVILCGAAVAAAGPDRLRRPHHPARGPGDLRTRLPLDPAVVDGAGADPAARRPTSSAGSSPGPASCRSASSPRSIGAPFFIALVRRRKLAEL